MRTDPSSTLLAVIDIQERLAAVVPDCDRLTQRTVRLAKGAEILGVRRALTEQYPKGLGPTVPQLAACMPAAEEKIAFSAAGCG